MSVTREQKKQQGLVEMWTQYCFKLWKQGGWEFEKLPLILPCSPVYEPRVSVKSHLLWKKKKKSEFIFKKFNILQ